MSHPDPTKEYGENEIGCPVCKGSGAIKAPKTKSDLSQGRRIAAQTLRTKGYSLREIATLLNLKSPNSVVWLLKK